MAIKGSLKEASLADVLQLLALGQKTGCLSVADRSSFGYIYFDRGRICYASIVNRRDRIGDLLVKNGKITQEQLDQAVQLQGENRDKRLGELLISDGAVTRDDLESGMRGQIEEAVYFLFTWTQGTFNFETDVKPERQDFLVSINPESLLLEGARRIDEWSLIEKKVPSFELIFALDKDRLAASQVQLTDEQQQIQRLGGRASVLHNLAFSYEQVGRLDEAEAAYGEAASRARHDYRVMIGWGIAGLARNEFQVAIGRLDRAREIAGERQLPALWYWARSLAAAGQDALDDAEAILREGLEAYPKHAVLRNNLAVLLEILGDVEQAEEIVRAALADEPSLPQPWKNLGDLLYRRGDYEEAWEAYQRAVKLQPQLGDDVYFKLGNIAYKRQDCDLAGALWKTALELNPRHELARTNLDTMSALA